MNISVSFDKSKITGSEYDTQNVKSMSIRNLLDDTGPDVRRLATTRVLLVSQGRHVSVARGGESLAVVVLFIILTTELR